MFVVWQDIPLG